MKTKKLLPVLFLIFTMIYACKCSLDNQSSSFDDLMEKSMGKIGGGKSLSPINYNYTVKDLCGDWVCNAVEGDLTEYFEVKISQKADNQICISNFHNLGKDIIATVSGTTVEFSGTLSSDYSVEGGLGVIDKSFGKIEMEYSVVDLENGNSEKFRITLIKGSGEDIIQNAR
ncbi:MAG: hypothetical protein II937_15620 [Bacteroidales bacterium]|nr:hypothetical protein [Bacteroidales bacterium]